MNYKAAISTAAGVIGGAISAAVGGWSQAMTTLILFMAVDYITGLLVAGVFHASNKSSSGALESRAGFKGLLRKAMVMVIVCVAYRLDLMAGTTMVKDAVIIAFCCNEGISILENAGIMGVPIPGAVKKALEMLNKEEEQ